MSKKYRYVGLIIVFALWITACSDKTNEENNQTSQRKDPIRLESQLQNVEKCYLCGNSDKSMMSYYRQFDTVGLIALNEWYVLDFGLGIEEISEGTKTIQGNNQGITYSVESVASRGMSHVAVSSDEAFNSTLIENNLCQDCLDKIEKVAIGDIPFVLIDFKELNLYAINEKQAGRFIRDYWIETIAEVENEIKFSIYHLLPKDVEKQNGNVAKQGKDTPT